MKIVQILLKVILNHFRYDPSNDNSIGSDYTLQIFESTNKTLWIGTIGGGLNKLIRNKEEVLLVLSDTIPKTSNSQ